MKGDDPPDFLQEKIAQLEIEITDLDIEERKLLARSNQVVELPSQEELRNLIQEVVQVFKVCNRETNSLLKTLLDGPIRAIPCQQFDSNKVVLRAEFDLQLIQLLPAEIRLQFNGDHQRFSEREILSQRITVDLFEPSLAPKHAMAALEFYERDPTNRPKLEEIGRHLGISKRSAHLALKMGKDMQTAGITDPFLPLTEKPDNPSRWRYKDAS